MLYSAILPAALAMLCLMVLQFVNNGLERAWKVEPWFEVRYYFSITSRNKENHTNFSQVTQSLTQDVNLGPNEMKAGGLLTQPGCLMMQQFRRVRYKRRCTLRPLSSIQK